MTGFEATCLTQKVGCSIEQRVQHPLQISVMGGEKHISSQCQMTVSAVGWISEPPNVMLQFDPNVGGGAS